MTHQADDTSSTAGLGLPATPVVACPRASPLSAPSPPAHGAGPRRRAPIETTSPRAQGHAQRRGAAPGPVPPPAGFWQRRHQLHGCAGGGCRSTLLRAHGTNALRPCGWRAALAAMGLPGFERCLQNSKPARAQAPTRPGLPSPAHPVTQPGGCVAQPLAPPAARRGLPAAPRVEARRHT
jgi:hypothetical protein